MTDRQRKTSEAESIVRRHGARRAAASADALIPELRSNVKWNPASGDAPPFRAEASLLLVWYFGVPLARAETLHLWLQANEAALAQDCSSLTGGSVQYLGTYLNTESGSPRYQTLWGIRSTEAWEAALTAALGNAALRDRIKELRAYWARDPSATDQLFGLAQRYAPLSSMNGGVFWDVTMESRAVP